MLINVSARNFGRAVRLSGGDVSAPVGDSRSKLLVSSHFVSLCADQLADWMAIGLYDLELVAIQIDRVHVKEKLLSWPPWGSMSIEQSTPLV